MGETEGFETIGRRLAATARRFARQQALVEGEASITFGDLDTAASNVSRQIVQATVGRQGFVGLLFDSKLAAKLSKVVSTKQFDARSGTSRPVQAASM